MCQMLSTIPLCNRPHATPQDKARDENEDHDPGKCRRCQLFLRRRNQLGDGVVMARRLGGSRQIGVNAAIGDGDQTVPVRGLVVMLALLLHLWYSNVTSPGIGLR